MTRHIVMVSGGLTSWYTALRITWALGRPPESVFADTLIEDDDLYRFLCESQAALHGVSVAPLRGLWGSIPDIDHEVARRDHLRRLASAAEALIPGFHWLSDGRTPWQVFRDDRFIGNSRIAPCSHALKQRPCRAWLERETDPAVTVIYVGIHYSESDRYYGTAQRRGVRDLWLPWRCKAPLCEPPYYSAADVNASLATFGIEPPRLYGLGFSHNNCGGFCVRAGQTAFRRLLKEFPERYAHHERREEDMRFLLQKDVSVMRRERRGVRFPLTMRQLREEVSPGPDDVEGGCGCFFDDPLEVTCE